MNCKELPKIINKTQADIDATIDTIQACDLPSNTKEFVISCVRLAIWLPNALLEQKIKLANLRKLIFGIGKMAQTTLVKTWKNYLKNVMPRRAKLYKCVMH